MSQMYSIELGVIKIYNIVSEFPHNDFNEVKLVESDIPTEHNRFFWTKEELLEYVRNLPELK